MKIRIEAVPCPGKLSGDRIHTGVLGVSNHIEDKTRSFVIVSSSLYGVLLRLQCL